MREIGAAIMAVGVAVLAGVVLRLFDKPAEPEPFQPVFSPAKPRRAVSKATRAKLSKIARNRSPATKERYRQAAKRRKRVAGRFVT